MELSPVSSRDLKIYVDYILKLRESLKLQLVNDYDLSFKELKVILGDDNIIKDIISLKDSDTILSKIANSTELTSIKSITTEKLSTFLCDYIKKIIGATSAKYTFDDNIKLYICSIITYIHIAHTLFINKFDVLYLYGFIYLDIFSSSDEKEFPTFYNFGEIHISNKINAFSNTIHYYELFESIIGYNISKKKNVHVILENILDWETIESIHSYDAHTGVLYLNEAMMDFSMIFYTLGIYRIFLKEKIYENNYLISNFNYNKNVKFHFVDYRTFFIKLVKMGLKSDDDIKMDTIGDNFLVYPSEEVKHLLPKNIFTSSDLKKTIYAELYEYLKDSGYIDEHIEKLIYLQLLKGKKEDYKRHLFKGEERGNVEIMDQITLLKLIALLNYDPSNNVIMFHGGVYHTYIYSAFLKEYIEYKKLKVSLDSFDSYQKNPNKDSYLPFYNLVCIEEVSKVKKINDVLTKLPNNYNVNIFTNELPTLTMKLDSINYDNIDNYKLSETYGGEVRYGGTKDPKLEALLNNIMESELKMYLGSEQQAESRLEKIEKRIKKILNSDNSKNIIGFISRYKVLIVIILIFVIGLIVIVITINLYTKPNFTGIPNYLSNGKI